jgi:murein DD-endopeptidase MepM/ murein hydrolase activator NlpD
MIKDSLLKAILRSHVYICQALLLMFCTFIPTYNASAISINGIFTQGGFIIGKLGKDETAPLHFGGYTLNSDQIGKDGTFVFGIPRNSKPNGLLKYQKKGIEFEVTFIIEPQDYPTQTIKNLPNRKVNPYAEDMAQIKADKDAILKARSIFTDDLKISIFTTPVQWPVSATISGVYGSNRTYNGEERSWHKGLDIAAPTGAEIKAPIEGVVRLALANSFFNGNLIILDHGHQLMTIYAHLNEMYVKNGDTVTPQTVIGTVGSTGRATGPHLHWGLYWRNMALDPLLLMKWL